MGSKKLKKQVFAILLFFPIFISFVAPSLAADHAEQKVTFDTFNKYNECNWLVVYRGRTYDLAPLTKPSLARPVEGDLRSVIQRVPSAETHLFNVNQKMTEAKVHTVIGSIAISSLLISRIFASSAKNGPQDKKIAIDIVSIASGLLFLKAGHASWEATRDSKRELVTAINVFNANSPHQIVPVSKGMP